MKNSYIVNQELRMNSIQFLLSRPFSSLQLEEKCEVKRLGRPTPRLELTQEVKTKGRTFNRNFNNDVYDKYDWLCGCGTKNLLFCFPCVLFGGEESWSKHGIVRSRCCELSEKRKARRAQRVPEGLPTHGINNFYLESEPFGFPN